MDVAVLNNTALMCLKSAMHRAIMVTTYATYSNLCTGIVHLY